jgi:hypothetical protein
MKTKEAQKDQQSQTKTQAAQKDRQSQIRRRGMTRRTRRMWTRTKKKR